MNTTAIKPGPKPKTEEGDLDKRRRVSPPNVPKYTPPFETTQAQKETVATVPSPSKLLLKTHTASRLTSICEYI